MLHIREADGSNIGRRDTGKCRDRLTGIREKEAEKVREGEIDR